MSHYTVAVIVDKLDENEVAKMLAPYQENNMGDCPREYLALLKNIDNQEKYIVLVDCHI